MTDQSKETGAAGRAAERVCGTSAGQEQTAGRADSASLRSTRASNAVEWTPASAKKPPKRSGSGRTAEKAREWNVLKQPAPVKQPAPEGADEAKAVSAGKKPAKRLQKAAPGAEAAPRKTGDGGNAGPEEAAEIEIKQSQTIKEIQDKEVQIQEHLKSELTQNKAAQNQEPLPEPPEQDGAAQQPDDSGPSALPQQPDVPAESAPQSASGEAEPGRMADGALDPEAERRRVEDMTRTVQVSIEQILAHAAEQEAKRSARDGTDAAQNPVPEPAEPSGPPEASKKPTSSRVKYRKASAGAEEPPDTMTRKMGRGAVGLFKWLMLVLFFVLLTAGAGIAMLYRSATPDAIPNITATLGGQHLEPSSYQWQVPVIGNRLKRTYAETLSAAPYPLAQKLENVRPVLSVTPSGLDVQITVKQEGETVFEGTLKEFNASSLPGNGDYSARLVVQQNSSRFDEGGTISGKQTYDFSFTVDVRPTVRLNTQTVTQGGVVAVRVANVPEGETPVLYTEFSHPAFTENGEIWLCYLPIPADAQPGNYTLQVEANGYRQDLPLAIREGNWISKDYSRESARVIPYIGVEDTPEEVKKLLGGKTAPIAWTETGFVQPFIDSVTQRLTYGTREFVGRTSIQKANNFDNGSARAATCAVVDVGGKRRLIAPADGEVTLAAQLNGTAGLTIVVDHGAGVRSIFYCLGDIAVKEGEQVRQGQTLGTASRTIVAEVRIGDVPVEPFAVWRMQCDAIKTIQ